MRSSSKALLASVPVIVAGLFSGQAAQAMSDSCLLVDLPSCNVTLENVTYSNFSFTGFTPDPTGDVFNLSGFANGAGTVTLSFSPDRVADISGASFTYTATLNNLYFDTAQANITGSTLGGGSYSTAFTAPGLPTSATSTGGAGAMQSFSPNLNTQTITQTFEFDYVSDPTTLSAVGGSFTAYVPGPLPLMGLGAAYGFSRKLRRRTKANI
ncbi:MAG: hypothetical protein RLZZ117_2671 [Cyanobacteriota bacterium]